MARGLIGYVVASLAVFALGFAGAWHVQQGRVLKAQQQLDNFRSAQFEALADARSKASEIAAEREELSRQLQEQSDEEDERVAALQAELAIVGEQLDAAYERLLDAAQARASTGERDRPGEGSEVASIGPGKSRVAPSSVSADVLGGLAKAAVDIGRYADALQIAGQSCERFADRATLVTNAQLQLGTPVDSQSIGWVAAIGEAGGGAQSRFEGDVLAHAKEYAASQARHADLPAAGGAGHALSDRVERAVYELDADLHVADSTRPSR